MPSLVIRPARAADYPGVARLMMQLQAHHAAFRPDKFRAAWPKCPQEEFCAGLQKPDNYWLVAADAYNRVLGYAYCQRFGWEASGNLVAGAILVMDELCVDETCRGRGIGKALVQAAKDLAVRLRVNSLELQVWEDNPGAARFYESCGMGVQRRRMEWRVCGGGR